MRMGTAPGNAVERTWGQCPGWSHSSVGPSSTPWVRTVAPTVTKCTGVYGSVRTSKRPNRCVLKCIEVCGCYAVEWGDRRPRLLSVSPSARRQEVASRAPVTDAVLAGRKLPASYRPDMLTVFPGCVWRRIAGSRSDRRPSRRPDWPKARNHAGCRACGTCLCHPYVDPRCHTADGHRAMDPLRRGWRG